MGIHRGPNTVKDGLVFGYDTGYGVADNNNATRFYPGEPATNNSILAAYTWNGDGGNQSFANKGATTITDNSLKYNGYDTVLWTPGGSLNCYLNSTSDFNYSDGSTVWTFSCYVKREDGAAITSLNVYMYYPSSDGAAAGTIVDCGNGWYRVSRTRTGGTSAIQLAGFTGFSSGKKYYLSGVMLSKTSHTVPYVAVQSSRSSTASLIDLKRTTSIDVSNISFDSTGQPDFDGTNDFITLGDFDLRPGFTLEAVCFAHTSSFALWGQGPTIASRGLHIIATGGTRGFVFGMYGNDCDYRNYAPVTNAWHHWVFTYDGTTFQKKFIADGVVQTPVVLTAENEWLEGESPLRLGTNYGSGTSYSKANGAIAVAKVYNRPLSNSEIINNYNAYKNRFDI